MPRERVIYYSATFENELRTFFVVPFFCKQCRINCIFICVRTIFGADGIATYTLTGQN